MRKQRVVSKKKSDDFAKGVGLAFLNIGYAQIKTTHTHHHSPSLAPEGA